jgi:hypothetical protein
VPDYPGSYRREHVILGDVSRDLGFPIAALQGLPSGPSESDNRAVWLNGLYFVVSSEVRGPNGLIMPGSLDDPKAVCTVGVSLTPARTAAPVGKKLGPRIRIKSVSLPKKPSESLKMTLEVSSEDGMEKLAVRKDGFCVRFSTADAVTKGVWLWGEGLVFPSGTPDWISIPPVNPPVALTVTESGGRFRMPLGGFKVASGPWADLPPGKYVVSIGITKWRGSVPPFDYDHVSGANNFSDVYEFVVK